MPAALLHTPTSRAGAAPKVALPRCCIPSAHRAIHGLGQAVPQCLCKSRRRALTTLASRASSKLKGIEVGRTQRWPTRASTTDYLGVQKTGPVFADLYPARGQQGGNILGVCSVVLHEVLVSPLQLATCTRTPRRAAWTKCAPQLDGTGQEIGIRHEHLVVAGRANGLAVGRAQCVVRLRRLSRKSKAASTLPSCAWDSARRIGWRRQLGLVPAATFDGHRASAYAPAHA
jgi:hypothetical protein